MSSIGLERAGGRHAWRRVAPMSFRRLEGRTGMARALRTIAFAIDGPIVRADLPGLCDRVCALLAETGADVAICDVRGVAPDGVTVDALARLQLAARRYECKVRLRHASPELLELVGFMGLRDVLAD